MTFGCVAPVMSNIIILDVRRLVVRKRLRNKSHGKVRKIMSSILFNLITLACILAFDIGSDCD